MTKMGFFNIKKFIFIHKSYICMAKQKKNRKTVKKTLKKQIRTEKLIPKIKTMEEKLEEEIKEAEENQANTKKTEIKNVNNTPTGITGFDKLLGGGLEKNSVTLLKGGTGTGKTIFSLQFIYNGIVKYNDPGIFISFEESKESIFTTARAFGWDLEKLEKEGKFAFLQYSPHEIEKLLKEGGGTVRDLVESMGAKRVAMDSLTAYSLLFRNTYQSTEGVLQLIQTLKAWNCTSILTEEKNVDIHAPQSGRVGFLTDGLIHMYYLRRESGRFRAIEVMKVRHVKHSDKIILFKIEKDGIDVHPESGIFSEEK